ncbi:hypothetical protein NHH03_20070 [Stieleria sp. TO1_6]|nr:hypothetical protein [Stieleria tagensis]
MPSSVIERYFSRSSHGSGMVFDLTLELDGVVGPDPLRDAWVAVVAGHHRLFWRLTGSGKRQHWVPAPIDDAKCFHIVSLEPTTDPTSVPAPDVRQGVGACLLVSNNTDYPAIRFRFHHCACDGVGAARVIGEFFAQLHGQSISPSGGESPAHSPTDRRGETTFPDLRNTWQTIRGRNVRVSKDVVDPVAKESGDAPTAANPLRSVASDTWAFELEAELSGKLRIALRNHKIPLNDYAVAATAYAIAQVSPHCAAAGKYVMVMNPTQMRRWSNRRSSANHLGFAFVRRRHDELGIDADQTAASILDSVHQQIQAVRSLRIAGELAYGIGAVEKIPGSLRLVEQMGWFTPTASLTCLSSIRFSRRYGFVDGACVGDTPIRNVGMSAPLQAGGELAVTIWEMGGPIGWSLRFASPSPHCHRAAQLLAHSIEHFSRSIFTSTSLSDT